MYLCSKGVNPVNHPVKKELDRIKDYMKKVKTAENPQAGSGHGRVNVEAANRFIKHALQPTEMEKTDSAPAHDEGKPESKKHKKSSQGKKAKRRKSKA